MEWKKFIRSFYYADEGIVYAISSQRNMKIHISAALFVLLLGMGLHFQYTDVLFILLSIAIVLTAELINTAIEKTVDLVTEEYHEAAKTAKDAAAGGVLISVMIVIFIGIMIIPPYFHSLYQMGWKYEPVHPPSFFVQHGLFLLLLTYALKAYWYQKNKANQPYVILAVLLYSFSLFTMMKPLLAYFLIIINLIYVAYLLKRKVSWIGIIQNGMISIGGFYILYWLFY